MSSLVRSDKVGAVNSHAAPYKHFVSQDELRTELARRWMASFIDAQEHAVTSTDAAADLLAAGLAYVDWAAEHPSRFALVFDPALNRGTGAGQLSSQAARHEQLLQRLVAAAIEAGVLIGPAEVTGRWLWALVHGLATLVILGQVPREAVPEVLRRALA